MKHNLKKVGIFDQKIIEVANGFLSELNKMRDSMSGSLQRGLETSPARIVFSMNGFDHEVFDFMGAIRNSEISHEIFLTSMLSKYLKKNEGILSDIFQVRKPPFSFDFEPLLANP